MTQWETPKVVIDKSVPNQYVAACAHLVTSFPDGEFYLDYRPADGYHNFGEGVEADSNNGVYFTNGFYTPTVGRMYSGIVAYTRYIPQIGSDPYTDEIDTYNVYVYTSRHAYVYPSGYIPPETPTPNHNFS